MGDHGRPWATVGIAHCDCVMTHLELNTNDKCTQRVSRWAFMVWFIRPLSVVFTKIVGHTKPSRTPDRVGVSVRLICLRVVMF